VSLLVLTERSRLLSNRRKMTQIRTENTIQKPSTFSPVLKYCLYARKSTEAEDKQVLSIDSQIKEMMALAQKEELSIVDIKKESHSSKEVGKRAIFNQMINEIKEGKYNAILTWAPDRISRNAGDLGTVVDLMDRKKLLEIRTFGQKFTDNPNEKFMLMILGSQAKLENDNKAVNVKRGLRARCEMGLWPAPAPTGYLSNPNRDKKCEPITDPERSFVIKQMFEKVAYEQWSGRKIYRWLRNELEFKTINGKCLTLSNIYLILNNHFYYGTFEYPKNSGNWYKGKHTPLISKEIFEEVQNHLKERYVSRMETKEFAFTRLIKCGYCGSGISADEKYKKLIDGTVNRHVYYMCTKSRNIDCKNKYINEKDLIEELVRIIDEVNLDELGIKEKVSNEFKRYNHFRMSVLGENKEEKDIKDVDIRNYAKYILKKGSVIEKRELLAHLRSQLVVKDKELKLE
jgi:site-specific DNA recombinase